MLPKRADSPLEVFLGAALAKLPSSSRQLLFDRHGPDVEPGHGWDFPTSNPSPSGRGGGCYRDIGATPSQALLEYPHPAGYKPLRSAISSYLRASRGVRCSEEQVLVANGSQQALNLTAQVLLNEGDVAWIEDPGYLGARGALQGSGAQLVPVPIDSRGLDIQAGSAKSPRAKIVCVTPSRQYPLGVTMVLSRRLELLDWARQTEAWVVEDDYDSEYRYKGLPISALQGLDTDGRVIYIGTFSKVLFPSLRLAYLVVPRDPVDTFTAARALMDMGTSVMEQAALADSYRKGTSPVTSGGCVRRTPCARLR